MKELKTYIDFPPMQYPASYNLGEVIAAGQEGQVSHAGALQTDGRDYAGAPATGRPSFPS